MDFKYDTKGSRGVKSVQEFAEDGTPGQKMTFDRTKYNTTTMQNAGADCKFGNNDDIKTVYQFDNCGKTVSIQSKTISGEDLGAAGYKYTGSEVNSTGSNIKSINKVSSNYTLGANRENLLKNHNMEGTSNWSYAAWGSGTVSGSMSASSTALYGQKSIVIDVSSVTGDARGRIWQDVDKAYLKQGATYTLSAYVKTENIAPIAEDDTYGAVIAVTPFNNDGSSTNIYSDHISRDTDKDINKGFRRLSVTFTVPTNSDFKELRINLALHSAKGKAYFDAVQLERSDAAGNYNMLENASFERLSSNTQPTDWTPVNLTDATNQDCISTASVDGKNSYRITGTTSNYKNLYQIVYLDSNAKEDDTYILSGWATANSVPIGSNSAKFRLLARVHYTDGTHKDTGHVLIIL